jgi:hypothetical protein
MAKATLPMASRVGKRVTNSQASSPLEVDALLARADAMIGEAKELVDSGSCTSLAQFRREFRTPLRKIFRQCDSILSRMSAKMNPAVRASLDRAMQI